MQLNPSEVVGIRMMESSVLFPPVKNPITMHEPNSTPSAAAAFKRFKPPQPPLFIPPGHVLFRLLCHASRIGGVIGKSGSIIKQLQQLTNCKIRVEDPPDFSENRIISVLASPSIIKQINLEEDSNGDSRTDFEGGFDVSAAQEGVVRVFERVVEMEMADGVVTCRLLVSKNQGGVVIGKGGKVVEKIRKETGCRIKVLGVEMFSLGSSPMDEIVEIEGLFLGVKKALVAITCRLQEFLPLEKTRTYGTRPLESESLPIQTVDLPLQRNPTLQPMPSNSVNHAWGNGPSLEFERVTDVSSRTPQQEVVFKILCPNERVGSIIGKGGSIIKTLQNETGASISIGPTLGECEERVITITAMESVESEYSPAQKATVVVFNRFVEYGVVSDAKGSTIARVMVPSHQVGCLLGKGGAIISEMRKVTGTGLRIIGGNQVPKCASENFEVLQITGEFPNVQDALYKMTGRLRDNIFSTTILTGNGNRNYLRTENGAYGRSTNLPPSRSHLSVGNSDNLDDHKSLIQSVDHLAISSSKDRIPSSSVFTSGTVSGLNQGNNMINSGRLPSVNGGVELGRGASAANSTVKIVVPEAVFGSIDEDNSSNLTMLRQISGAKVTVSDPLPGATQRVVVISGTPDETQAAQSLLQAFMLTGS